MVTMVMCSVEIVDSCFYVGSLVVTHCIDCKPVQLLSVKAGRKHTYIVHCSFSFLIELYRACGKREREKERESVTLTPKL